jgi:hypothetical protein
MTTEQCKHSFKNYSQQISLFSYIQFSVHVVLTPIEFSNSLTKRLAVRRSLCRRKLARCFAATPRALSLESTRIPSYALALSP